MLKNTLSRLTLEISELSKSLNTQKSNVPDLIASIDSSLSEAKQLLESSKKIERLKQENQLFRETSIQLAHDMGVESLAHLIMDTIDGVVDFDAAGLYFLDPFDNNIRWETLRGYDTDKLHLVKQKLDQGIMAWCNINQKAAIVENVHTDTRYLDCRENTLSELVVPIFQEKRLIGFFNLESDKPANYNTDDLTLVEVFASQVARAVEHSMLMAEKQERRRVEAEVKVARRIQRNLLPDNDLDLQDVVAAGCNITSEEIGGDYFDHFIIDENNLGLVIADVSGKGIPASLIMAGFRTGLRLLVQHRYQLTEIMSCLNNHFERVTKAETFITAWYGVYHRPSGRLTYVNAGHNPPLLLSPVLHRTTKLEIGGLVLGAFPDAEYYQGFVDLQIGDMLVCYTDGADEAQDPTGAEMGVEGLHELFWRFRSKAPREFIDNLIAELKDFTGRFPGNRSFSDDLTLMTLRRYSALKSEQL
jgi:phosphoserine phosphatase RsbU/P